MQVPALTLSDATVAGLFRLAQGVGAKHPVVDGQCFYCGFDCVGIRTHAGDCLYILALNLTSLEALR
jgi:hypothetical protein